MLGSLPKTRLLCSSIRKGGGRRQQEGHQKDELPNTVPHFFQGSVPQELADDLPNC